VIKLFAEEEDKMDGIGMIVVFEKKKEKKEKRREMNIV
jgi:hypothetical protein